ncbi:tyrosine decarboxylase 1-like protein [Tanacetum coccineum]
MESIKLATALTITMIVFMAFTSSGTMAQEFGAAPAPAPSMESAGMALQVPAILSAVVSKTCYYKYTFSYLFGSIKSNTMNPLEPKEFRRMGHTVIDFLADYYQNIQNYPVRSQVNPGYLLESLPDHAPMQPESIETILKDVHRNIIPGITHWQSPNFFAHFASSESAASFVGEMLMNGFSIVGFNWESSPAATELEIVVMEWLLGFNILGN